MTQTPTQAATAIQALPFGIDTPPAKSIRQKAREVAESAVSAVASAFSRQSEPGNERPTACTPFGTFYESQATRRLITVIAHAEDLKAISTAAHSMQLSRDELKTKLIGLRKYYADIPGATPSVEWVGVPEAIVTAIEHGTPFVSEAHGDFMRALHHQAQERYSLRGNGSIECEPVPASAAPAYSGPFPRKSGDQTPAYGWSRAD